MHLRKSQPFPLSTRAAAPSCTTLPNSPDLIHGPMSRKPFECALMSNLKLANSWRFSNSGAGYDLD